MDMYDEPTHTYIDICTRASLDRERSGEPKGRWWNVGYIGPPPIWFTTPGGDANGTGEAGGGT
eukprot:7065975-Karenia_brevis.AAC.1